MATHLFAAAAEPVTIQWNLFVFVLLAALVGTVVIAVAYATGLRLLALAHGDEGGDAVRSSTAAMLGAVVCFAISIAAVLFGLILVIPQLKAIVFPS